MELNPEHPVTKATNGQWHKIAALMMIKEGKTEMMITEEDIKNMDPDTCITVIGRPDGILVKVMKVAEAIELMQADVEKGSATMH